MVLGQSPWSANCRAFHAKATPTNVVPTHDRPCTRLGAKRLYKLLPHVPVELPKHCEKHTTHTRAHTADTDETIQPPPQKKKILTATLLLVQAKVRRTAGSGSENFPVFCTSAVTREECATVSADDFIVPTYGPCFRQTYLTFAYHGIQKSCETRPEWLSIEKQRMNVSNILQKVRGFRTTQQEVLAYLV